MGAGLVANILKATGLLKDCKGIISAAQQGLQTLNTMMNTCDFSHRKCERECGNAIEKLESNDDPNDDWKIREMERNRESCRESAAIARLIAAQQQNHLIPLQGKAQECQKQLSGGNVTIPEPPTIPKPGSSELTPATLPPMGLGTGGDDLEPFAPAQDPSPAFKAGSPRNPGTGGGSGGGGFGASDAGGGGGGGANPGDGSEGEDGSGVDDSALNMSVGKPGGMGALGQFGSRGGRSGRGKGRGYYNKDKRGLANLGRGKKAFGLGGLNGSNQRGGKRDVSIFKQMSDRYQSLQKRRKLRL